MIMYMALTDVSNNPLIAASSAVVFLFSWKLLAIITRPWFSPFRHLPGLSSWNPLWGNQNDMRLLDVHVDPERWSEKYGQILKYRGFFNRDRLFTTDLKAITHIIGHSFDYRKPDESRWTLQRILGNGLLVTEGNQHKQQKRIMNPSFNPTQIRELTTMFVRKSHQLRDIWLSIVPEGRSVEIEVSSWLSKVTLDMIGLAGFNYNFNALTTPEANHKGRIGKDSSLSDAFAILLHNENQFHWFGFVQAFIPFFRQFKTKHDRVLDDAQATMLRIGLQMIEDRKNAILGHGNNDGSNYATKKLDNGHSDESDFDMKGKDLLTLLVKANMDTELPESGRMKDEDVLAQVPTFLVAGHETTSTEVMWTLYMLSQPRNLECQRRLRKELLSVADLGVNSTEESAMDVLNGLKYLDNVVREVLRLYPAVPSTMRIAEKEDILPLTKGHLKIGKGDSIYIPIIAINRAKEIWGDDAYKFNPDRWDNIPISVNGVPGVWGGMMTFMGGARSCIGYRFALMEMKALLFSIIRAFEFELAVPEDKVETRSFVVQRPYIKDDMKDGAPTVSKMPLLVKRYKLD